MYIIELCYLKQRYRFIFIHSNIVSATTMCWIYCKMAIVRLQRNSIKSIGGNCLQCYLITYFSPFVTEPFVFTYIYKLFWRSRSAEPFALWAAGEWQQFGKWAFCIGSGLSLFVSDPDILEFENVWCWSDYLAHYWHIVVSIMNVGRNSCKHLQFIFWLTKTTWLLMSKFAP